MEFKPATLDLPSFCAKLTEEVRSSTVGRCPIDFRSGSLPPARGDESMLHHILNNLLTNAVKYSPDGGPVEFSLERQDDQAIFCVKDKGMGIPLPDQKQLFSAFHRASNVTHLPGTGLGLVIVKRCVEMHGGQIECQSKEGMGTTFTVRLPLFKFVGSSRDHEKNPIN